MFQWVFGAASPLPGHPLHCQVREIVRLVDGNTRAFEVNVCQWVWKRAGARPGHRKHEVKRDAQRLCTVDMCEARRVCNDGVSREGQFGRGIRPDTRSPRAVENLCDCLSLLLYLSRPQAAHAGYQAGVLNHVGHQLGRVTADREELEACL